MFKQNYTLRVLKTVLCYGFLCALTGCTLLWQNDTPPTVVCPPQSVVVACDHEEEPFTPNLKPAEYQKEIGRLQRVIVSHPTKSEKVEAHYQLAVLYASYNNPEKNYQYALQQLTSYITMHPQAKQDYDVQNRLSLLKKLTQLSDENTTLKQTIEDIKILDQQIEQKRERYR